MRFMLIISILLSAPMSLCGQCKTSISDFKVQVDGNPAAITLYSIHEKPYCTIDGLAKILANTPKKFGFTHKTENDTWDYCKMETYKLDTRVDYIPKDIQESGTNFTKTSSVYAVLYVDKIKKPTTPYNIGKSQYFKLYDLLRILDIDVNIDSSNNIIKLNTSKPYTLRESRLYNADNETPKNNAPYKWRRYTGSGQAINLLMGHYSYADNIVAYEQYPNLVRERHAVIADLKTGNKIDLPFYGFPYIESRRFSSPVKENHITFKDGWIVTYNHEDENTFVNKNGEVINSSMFYRKVNPFRNGYAAVEYDLEGEKYSGVIDTDGYLVVALAGNYDVFTKKNYIHFTNKYKDDHFFDYQGKRLNLSKYEQRNLDVENYNKAEIDNFQKYFKTYKSVEYCGFNRFIVNNTKVVNSDNETIYQQENISKITASSNNRNLYFIIHKYNGTGVIDINGNAIIDCKYSQVALVDGDAFLTIIDNRQQSLISSKKELLASSPNAPLCAIADGEIITLREFLLDSEIVEGDIVMIYSNLDLDKQISTKAIKSIIDKGIHNQPQRYQVSSYNLAKKMATAESASVIEVLSLEKFISGFIKFPQSY